MIASVSSCCICRLVPTPIKANEWIQSIQNTFTSFCNKTYCHLFHALSHHLQVTFHPITMVEDHCSNGCSEMTHKSMETPQPSSSFGHLLLIEVINCGLTSRLKMTDPTVDHLYQYHTKPYLHNIPNQQSFQLPTPP